MKRKLDQVYTEDKDFTEQSGLAAQVHWSGVRSAVSENLLEN